MVRARVPFYGLLQAVELVLGRAITSNRTEGAKMYRALGGVVASTLMVGLALSPASVSAATAAPTTVVTSQAHHAPAPPAAMVTSTDAKVVLTRVTIPMMPAGPNWRCYGNVIIWHPSVCIYVRYVGTKVLSIQGQIWMRVEGPVTGLWTMEWSPTRSMSGHFWYQSKPGRYGASVIANHWTTPQINFNRVVPRDSYVSFAFWEWYSRGWHLKRVEYFAIV